MVELSASKLSLVSRNVSSVDDVSIVAEMFLDIVVIVVAVCCFLLAFAVASADGEQETIRCQRRKPSDELAFHKPMCVGACCCLAHEKRRHRRIEHEETKHAGALDAARLANQLGNARLISEKLTDLFDNGGSDAVVSGAGSS